MKTIIRDGKRIVIPTREEQKEIAAVVLLLRQRTGVHYGHNVEAGAYRLVTVEYDDTGRSTVTEVRGLLPWDEHAADLRARLART